MGRYFTFSFDDGYASWMKAATLLEKYNYRGSFNVTLRNAATRRLTTRLRMWPDTITWEEVSTLQSRGHEITSHGLRHIDLVDATDDELWAELEVSRRIFSSRDIPVKTFTCPFNEYNDRIGRISAAYYSYIRGRSRLNTLPLSGRVYHSLSWPDAVEVIADNVWAVAAWHDVTDFRKFEDTIKMVKALGAKVVTVEEMFKGAA